MSNDFISVHCNGEQFRGEASKLIKVFEAKGFQAPRENQDANPFWQAAEYLKRGDYKK